LIGPGLVDEKDRQAPRTDDRREKIGQLNTVAAGYAVAGRVLASRPATTFAPALARSELARLGLWRLSFN